MFTLFLRERSAWISFFLILLLFMNILFYLDIGLLGVSVEYFNLVIISLFTLFLLWRYKKEINQLKNFLGNIYENNFNEIQTDNLSPFQRKYLDVLYEVIQNKDNILNNTKIKVQEDTDDALAWIHEIKTPLTAMKLMLDQIDDDKTRRKIEIEWVRISYLLDQQLHSTRLATIEKDNRFETLNIKTIVYKEIKEFQSWCLEKGIGFQIEGLDKEVVSDGKWMAFIIRQILSNAIKYSYENTEVHIYTEVDLHNHLLLHIIDHGVGIDSGDIPRIFQKSFTGTMGRESSQSTGMGLYLAESAAKKLGIKIFVKSIKNEGSTFTVQFPNENEYQVINGR